MDEQLDEQLREYEVPSETNVASVLNAEEPPMNEDGMGEWLYFMWIDSKRQQRLEAGLKKMAINFHCKRLEY